MNWDDPAARLAHIERVGHDQYNRDLEEHMARSTVATVNGYAIRPMGTRFGRLFMVVGTNTAFATLDAARAHAAKQPARAP